MTEKTTKLPRSRRPMALTGLMVGLTIAACGGGGDGGGGGNPPNLPPPPPAPPPVITGAFKDFTVSGLAFESGQQIGVTDSEGRFTCETGGDVSFSIGGVSLGDTVCATFVAPNQLATLGAGFDLEVANLARFLQMLDRDGDPDNGIEISTLVQQAAENWNQVDFLTSDLDTELVTIISDAASVDGTPHTLPNAQEALTHLVDTLVCQYAGAYAGSISGTNSGAAGMVIGWTAPRFGFVPLAFEWQGYDAVNETGVFGGGGGSISILDLPVIDHTGSNLAGPIEAQFIDPDTIVGTWEGGNLELNRIGGDNGATYRLVGKASNSGFDEEVEAYVSLNLDGSSLNGQAFDVYEGTSFEISGSLAGDVVTLTATGGGSTFNGTGSLTRNPDGTPDTVTGTLEDGSSFSLAACRLN